MEKVIVVGAGLSGATIARLLAESGKDVIVVDKRENIGGNIYDYYDKNGILVQAYGPHVFHTNDEEVFEFLSKFTEWNEYKHKVVARVRKDKFVPVPFNLTSLYSLFPLSKALCIEEALKTEVGEGNQIPILELRKSENPLLREFADFVYKYIFYIYTMKQWGCKPEQLGQTIMGRVPVKVSNDDGYFSDKYQVMPQKGFTQLISNILRHPRIKLKLKTDLKKEIALKDGQIYFGGRVLDGTLIYTGCVDELFDYKYGVLPYRSLKFKFQTLKQSSFQPASVVNYTTSASYTRITEFTKFTCKPKDSTVIVKEYAVNHKKGRNIPHYPVTTGRNKVDYDKYEQEAKNYKNLYLLGRLGTYRYLNMDQAVKNAINLFAKIEGEEFDMSTIPALKKKD